MCRLTTLILVKENSKIKNTLTVNSSKISVEIISIYRINICGISPMKQTHFVDSTSHGSFERQVPHVKLRILNSFHHVKLACIASSSYKMVKDFLIFL